MDVEAVQRRMRLALDMAEAGEQMMRARIRRETAGITDADVDERIREWRRDRPGAEHGDAVGVPTHRFG